MRYPYFKSERSEVSTSQTLVDALGLGSATLWVIAATFFGYLDTGSAGLSSSSLESSEGY
jgi:hypothetical protein